MDLSFFFYSRILIQGRFRSVQATSPVGISELLVLRVVDLDEHQIPPELLAKAKETL
jgi:hypothetical protein